jgi:hypothetical protein
MAAPERPCHAGVPAQGRDTPVQHSSPVRVPACHAAVAHGTPRAQIIQQLHSNRAPRRPRWTGASAMRRCPCRTPAWASLSRRTRSRPERRPCRHAPRRPAREPRSPHGGRGFVANRPISETAYRGRGARLDGGSPRPPSWTRWLPCPPLRIGSTSLDGDADGAFTPTLGGAVSRPSPPGDKPPTTVIETGTG